MGGVTHATLKAPVSISRRFMGFSFGHKTFVFSRPWRTRRSKAHSVRTIVAEHCVPRGRAGNGPAFEADPGWYRRRPSRWTPLVAAGKNSYSSAAPGVRRVWTN